MVGVYYYSPAGKNSISVTKETLEKLKEKFHI